MIARPTGLTDALQFIEARAQFAAARDAKIVTCCPEYRETPQGLVWSILAKVGYDFAETLVSNEVVA